MLLHDARRDARVGRGRRAGPARRPGPRRAGTARGSPRAGRSSSGALADAPAGPVPAPGGDRGAPRRGGHARPTPTGRRSPRSTRALQRMTPSPVVELNLAAAVAMADGPAVGLAMMDGLAAAGRARRLPVPPRGPRRPAPPARALVRGRDRLPARARAHDERPGAGVPRGPDPRGRGADRRRQPGMILSTRTCLEVVSSRSTVVGTTSVARVSRPSVGR